MKNSHAGLYFSLKLIHLSDLRVNLCDLSVEHVPASPNTEAGE